jgi:serine phosphatase RsbU (regulator of sigma subunit)
MGLKQLLSSWAGPRTPIVEWLGQEPWLKGRLPEGLLLLLLLQRILASLHLQDPASLPLDILLSLCTLLLGLVVLLQVLAELLVHKPWQSRKRERVILWVALFLGALGLALDTGILLAPLVARPLLRFLRREDLRRRLPYFTAILFPLLLVLWSRELAEGIRMGNGAAGQDVMNLGGKLDTGLIFPHLGPLRTLAQCWVGLHLPLLVLVLTGRLLKQSRIRTKLAMNALFSSVMPFLVLFVLFGTVAVVVMGSYRARLVRAQFEEQLESARLVTAWFAQAYADPLDREAQQRFEQQLQTLGDDTPIGRGFFSLYLPVDPAQLEAEADSSRREGWVRLVSTWRMPGAFPLEKLELPGNWRQGPTTGVVHVGGHAWQAALIQQGSLLSVGFFPLDAQALESLGGTLGTGIRLVAVKGQQNLIHFALNQVGLRLDAGEQELVRTADFPGADHGLLERIFQVGLARVGTTNFPLDTPDEELLVQVEALPGRIFPAVVNDEHTLVFPYVLLLALQLVVLLPVLLTGIWIAWLLNWRITRSIDELRHGTDELARGNLELRLPEQTGDELGVLARSFNEMSRRVRENIRQLAAQERLERELSIARSIQQGLLPGKAPEDPHLEIASTCRMAHEVGGDYYDFRRTHKGELALALGDVSGKGVAAALVMSNLQASWRSLLDQGLEPDGLNARLNDQLAESTADDIFVTFVQGMFRPHVDGLRFRYSNAGHNPPLLVREGHIRRLDSGGLALGMFGGATYQTEELSLRPGDQLVFYTDGLTEAMSLAEEEFGQGRLEETLRCHAQPSAQDTLHHLLDVVGRFEGESLPQDDQTVVVLRVREQGL